jgi:hypothetical protein
MKRTVPLIICSLTGFILIISWFLPAAESWGEKVTQWFDIVAAFAFVLGGANLLKIHLQKISNRRIGWGYSAVTLTAFLVTLSAGLFKINVNPSMNYPAHSWSGSYLDEGGMLWWIYEYLFVPLSATLFAMLAFYITSAAFRAFRAKNIEASILLFTAFLILLGRTYAGSLITSGLPESLAFLRFENLTIIIMSVFNLAGSRAITIGIALGVVTTSLKLLLAVDRSYLGSD